MAPSKRKRSSTIGMNQEEASDKAPQTRSSRSKMKRQNYSTPNFSNNEDLIDSAVLVGRKRSVVDTTNSTNVPQTKPSQNSTSEQKTAKRKPGTASPELSKPFTQSLPAEPSNTQCSQPNHQMKNSRSAPPAKKALTVTDLKIELSLIGASTKGKKNDLIERLEAYRRNNNFDNTTTILPPPKLPDWPTSGFKTLTASHRDCLPPIHQSHIKTYIQYRQVKADNKAIPNGERLLVSKRVQACSMAEKNLYIFFSGIVRAAMRKKLSYSVLLKLDKRGEIENTSCECAAGKGPHGTCKHVACLLLMLKNFKKDGELKITEGCTDVLQTFHEPKKNYDGSPVKAINLGHIDENRLRDPRPEKFRNMPHYNDFVRNLVLNYSAATQEDLTMRYLYGMANMEYAAHDHDYLELPFQEYWVDRSNKVSESEAGHIEKNTRDQSSSRVWEDERKFRLTASKYGAICHITERRDITKLCEELLNPPCLKTDPVLHGTTYEPIAIEQFEEKYNVVVERAGLEVHPEYQMLAGSTDGHVGTDKTIEVKAPYSGREEEVRPHSKFFPFLYNDNGTIRLKRNSNHYFQVQGQLAITGRKSCYFIVYTFKSLYVTEVPFDPDFWNKEVLPKLLAFYTDHYRPYIAEHMYESVGQVRRKKVAKEQGNEKMPSVNAEDNTGTLPKEKQGDQEETQHTKGKPCERNSKASTKKSRNQNHPKSKCDDPFLHSGSSSSRLTDLSEQTVQSSVHHLEQSYERQNVKRKLSHATGVCGGPELKNVSFCDYTVFPEGNQVHSPKKHDTKSIRAEQMQQRTTCVGCLFSEYSTFGLYHQEPFEMKINGQFFTFSSVMQCMVVTKLLFAKKDITEALSVNHPEILRRMYTEVEVDSHTWEKEEEEVVYNTYVAKFMWLSELQAPLVKTCPHDLVLASPDFRFGGGYEIDDIVYEICTPGCNIAGKALVLARSYLMNLDTDTITEE